MLEGVPGSGKSYHGVAQFLLPWVRSKRRMYVHLDGFHLDRLARFEDVTVEELQSQITLWRSMDEVLAGLLTVEPGSAVFIDEAQFIFRAQQKLPPDILRWLETHRHKGIDITVTCQSWKQVTSGFTRLVESTTHFRKLSRIGLQKRYQGKVRGNPEEIETIRPLTGTYDSRIYSYYDSYRSGAREVIRANSVFRSPLVAGGLVVGLVAILGMYKLSSSPITLAADVQMNRSILPPPPPLPTEVIVQPGANVAVEKSNSTPTVTVEGVFQSEDGVWMVMLEGGQTVSEVELALMTGHHVQTRLVNGILKLKGEGFVYGGKSVQRFEAVGPSVISTKPVTDPIHSGRVEFTGVQPEYKEGVNIKDTEHDASGR